MRKIAFTICSNNYLAQAKIVSNSFLINNKDYEFYICISDNKNKNIDYSFLKPAKLIFVDELEQDIKDLKERYNIVEFNTALKPFFFEHLFSLIEDKDFVIYFDPDIKVYSRLFEIENILKDDNIILTPHIINAPKKESFYEKTFLNVGIYNFGFLGIKKNKDTKKVLIWFKDRLRKNCVIDACKGLFVDQIWGNFFPAIFDNVNILKHPGYNVAYWNLHERDIMYKNGIYFVNDNYRLKFFHFSGYYHNRPDMSSSKSRRDFNNKSEVAKLYHNYNEELIKNDHDKFKQIMHSFLITKVNPFKNINLKPSTKQ